MTGSRRSGAGCRVEALESRRLLSAAVPIGGLALSEGPAYTTGGATSVAANGTAYFAVTRSFGTTELWKRDAAAGATPVMVKSFQVFQTTDVAGPPPVANLTVVGGSVYFTVGVIDGSRSFELWKSDGTGAGTIKLGTFNGVASAGVPSLTNVDGTVYFVTSDNSVSTPNPKLWRSDGTVAGTKQVMAATSASIGHLTVIGSTLYFSADGLYKVTGPTATPVKVSTATPVSGRSTAGMGGTLYYVGGPSTSVKLYRYDGGLAAGPLELVTITNSVGRSPELTASGGRLFFDNSTVAAGMELWQSDGTAAGTQMVKDVRPGNVESGPTALVDVAGTLYFTANDGTHGQEVWRSDGTEAGTTLVSDLAPGSPTSLPRTLTAVGDTLYFTGGTAESGIELWRSDGTADGTTIVRDLYLGAGGSRPKELCADGDRLYFQAIDSVGGYGMFSTDVGAAGVNLVYDYIPGLMNGTTSMAVTPDGKVLLAAGDASFTGRELFATDGTPGSLALLSNINTTAWTGSTPNELTLAGATVFFSATGPGTQGNELWKTDGTAAGTMVVKDLAPFDGYSVSPRSLRAIGSSVYYAAGEGTSTASSSSFVLWTSDGTDAGTKKIPFGTLPQGLAVMGGALYMFGGANVLQRYTPGMPNVVDLKTFSSALVGFGVVGAYLYMSANLSGTGGFEPWRSDGTSAGTVLVKDINTNTNVGLGTTGSGPSGFTELGGLVYFSALDLPHGNELWRTDGTAAGTVLVKEIAPGTAGSTPQRFVKVGNRLVFTADDATHGRELWTTDGTADGTVLLADLNAGAAASTPTDLTRVGNLIYFSADDGAGRRLWVTDGTAAGTRPLNLPGSNPLNLRDVNGTLYYTANDGVTGPALFKWDASAVAPTVSAAQFTPNGAGGAGSVELDFSQEVAATLRAGDLRLRNLTTGALIDPTGFEVAVSPTGGRATVSFAGHGGVGLADGDYRLTVPAGTVRDAAGVALAGDFPFDFFVLAGDADRDRSVGFSDLVAVAQNYDGVEKNYAQGDFNGDGRVDFADLVRVAQGYDNALPPLAAPAASRAVGASAKSVKALFSVTPVKKAAGPVAKPKAAVRAIRR